MYSRDLERLVRQLVRQRCEEDYIRYYLSDTYQLDEQTIEEIFTKLGLGNRGAQAMSGMSDTSKKQQNRASKFF